MSIEELDARSVALKEEQLAIRAQRVAIREERDRKVLIRRIRNELGSSQVAKAAVAAGVLQVPDDLTLEQAAEILAMVRQTKRPGDVTVSPEPAELRAVPGAPEAGGAA